MQLLPDLQPTGAADAASDDRVLVALSLAGDGAAFGRLMMHYSPLIHAVLLGKSRTREDAEDLLQETFLSAWHNLKSLRSPEHLGGWLVRIARNRLTDHSRKRPSPVSIEAIYTNRGGGAEPSGIPGLETEADALHTLTRAETRARILGAIGELPERYRIVVYLRLIEEMGYASIASRLRLKESAVKMRMKRALERLRKKLEKIGIE